ncbi:MAG: hypothetical protein US54_C0070G0003 [Candidatus Roizmanbacteria bacterium GW2011_GWA2_37_7]|uniref:Uncharacterized protein n=1 Tax=Candidatus Roizmanbacteria bacterium GW2011_GWA2_37_7 TaxID=1618481 RepID=A0A0G0JHX7_9BACT|nr:MAG: hypothetical protein US54_C0070G0003 [Candidatus Roizmanbacteria bacterium GW2011_GWA2_37_7]
MVGVGVLFQTNKAEETKVIPITRENDQKKVVSEEDQVGKQSNNLVITSPNDHTIIAKNTIEVVGKVKANSLIAIQSAAAEIIEKNEKENFTIEVPLAVGENVIQVSVYADTSTPQEQTLRIYYIPAE